jgi:hypothetical protein
LVLIDSDDDLLYGAAFMVLALRRHIRFVGHFGGSKNANVAEDASDPDRSAPLPVEITNAQPAGTIATLRPPLVLLIRSTRCVAQVAEAVCKSISVYMIDDSLRPRACHIKPRKTMSVVQHAINPDQPVSGTLAEATR